MTYMDLLILSAVALVLFAAALAVVCLVCALWFFADDRC